MPTLRADENRYLLAAEGRAALLATHIPGARQNALHHALQLPRQPGVILALDDLFGPEGWDCSAELSIELADARGRIHAEPQHTASLELVNGEFAIECAFADKELVKLVPGYRWSAPTRRWFTPAAPMALDLLRKRFGSLLEVSGEAATFAELRRSDEEAALSRSGETAPLPATASPPPAQEIAAPEEAPPEPAFNDQIGRLTAAIEALEGTMRTLVARLDGVLLPAVPTAPAPPAPVAQASDPGLPGEWRNLLARAPIEPAETLAAAGRLLQTASPEAERPLREVMGIAAALNGDHEAALSYLRRALDPNQPAPDGDLRLQSIDAYCGSVLALISAECGPERPIGSIGVFEELLLEELVTDQGFKDSVLASRTSQDRLDYLVNDSILHQISPRLSDCCRTAHLVAISKGGVWMAVERVIDVIRDPGLGDEGFALGLIVLANNLHQAAAVSEWQYDWPRDDGGEDLAWLSTAAALRLVGVDGRLATYAALSCLACIATGPAEWATVAQRRSLVQLVPPKATIRRYAEFLAGFRLATETPKAVLTQFQGYLQILAQYPLAITTPHLEDVFMHDSGGPASISRALADSVVLESIAARGVAEPQSEVMDLLDMLAESPRADNLMNRLARMIEDREFPGAELFTRTQRKELQRRALNSALGLGHDHDSVEAFDRLVRELRNEGADTELLNLCHGLRDGLRALRVPAALVLLGLLLEAGEPFEDTLERLTTGIAPADEEQIAAELAGLGLIFPALRSHLAARAGEIADVSAGAPEFSGKRLLVVGGHEWLKKHALPTLTGEWHLAVDWLDPDAAKNGGRVLDLAGGATDLIVINTACIGHAASGRVIEEARRSGKLYFAHDGRGIGALLSFVRKSFESGQTAPEPKRPSKLADKRRLVR